MEVQPEGQAYLDDIVLSYLIIERMRRSAERRIGSGFAKVDSRVM